MLREIEWQLIRWKNNDLLLLSHFYDSIKAKMNNLWIFRHSPDFSRLNTFENVFFSFFFEVFQFQRRMVVSCWKAITFFPVCFGSETVPKWTITWLWKINTLESVCLSVCWSVYVFQEKIEFIEERERERENEREWEREKR